MPATPAAASAKPTRRGAKPHVPSACANCKRAHLACDLQRPCRRCVKTNKCDTCWDVEHKKRGRPRSKDKKQQLGGSAAQTSMESRMFQFSFTAAAAAAAARGPTGTAPTSPVHAPTMKAVAATTPSPAAPLSPNTIASAAPSPSLPPPGSPDAATTGTSHVSTSVSEKAATSHLFLTPGLACLRLEEARRPGMPALLGHSLLSIVNRSALDLVSEPDKSRVFHVFDSVRRRIAARLGTAGSAPAGSYANAGSLRSAVDPDSFQAVPVDHLLRPIGADIFASVRAHLRVSTGYYDLFDVCVYAGAVPSTRPTPTMDEVYFVFRISKFDPLGHAPAALGGSQDIRVHSLEHVANGHPRKRQCTSSEPVSGALHLLAEVTSDASDCRSSASSPEFKQSPATSSPGLATPSPSLTATLPPLSDLLKSLDAGKNIRSPASLMRSCISP